MFLRSLPAEQPFADHAPPQRALSVRVEFSEEDFSHRICRCERHCPVLPDLPQSRWVASMQIDIAGLNRLSSSQT